MFPTEIDPAASDGSTSDPVSPRSRLADLQLRSISRFDLYVAVVAGLLTVAWIPIFLVATQPRHAITLSLLPVGLAFLFVRASRRSAPAVVALFCCLAFILSGMQAESPRVAFAGQTLQWASVTAMITSVAWWAVGREMTARGAEVVIWSLTGGAMLNGLIGFAQLLFAAERTSLVGVPGRASGLMFNPVYYGAFMVGMAALWMARASRGASRSSLALCSTLSFLAALSGSRVVLAALVLASGLAVFAWRRAARSPVLWGFVGVVAAELVMRATGDARSTLERLGGKDGDGRVAVWGAGLRAFMERPLLGWGPSNVELAIQPRLGQGFAREHWGEGTVVIWSDPHNVVVLLLVSTGLVGTLLSAAFVLSALNGRWNAPLLIGAFAMSVSLLLQPFTVYTVPVALLLLGMAVRPEPPSNADVDAGDDERRPGLGVRWRNWAVYLGVGLTSATLVATFVVDRAIENHNPDRAASVARVFVGDPSIDIALSQAYLSAYPHSDEDATLFRRGLAYAERAARTFPTTSNHLAVAHVALVIDDQELARSAFERAISEQPWDPRARQQMYLFARSHGDLQLADEQARVLCSLGELLCPVSDASGPEAGDVGSARAP